jgi:putative radical SAM enzyme (TIGR03279 family)
MSAYDRVTHYRGIKIRSMAAGTPFYRAGLRNGDCIVAINGNAVSDELDFRFYAASPLLRLNTLRNNWLRTVIVERKANSFPAINFYQKPIRRCANRCIFCFIDQMPPGLRQRLYIKDEDLTRSFLNGNYVTLTNADRTDLQRIVRLGLSPMYISVHATDPHVRNRLLGVKTAPPIIEQLSFLARKGIQIHAQIVVCPGYNDGATLSATVSALFSLGANLLSIAVVPVGLTRFRSSPLTPVDERNAREICKSMGRASDRDNARRGKRRLFLADELFLKAGHGIPPRAYYEDYPQIENGVGLLRQMLDKWNDAKRHLRRPTLPARRPRRKKKCLLITSCSAFPFLRAVASEAEGLRPDLVIHVEAVPNRFFGLSVTVAGLLTARDVIRAVRRATHVRPVDRVLLPAVMFNYTGATLDGYRAQRIAKEAGVPIRVIDSPAELLNVK